MAKQSKGTATAEPKAKRVHAHTEEEKRQMLVQKSPGRYNLMIVAGLVASSMTKDQAVAVHNRMIRTKKENAKKTPEFSGRWFINGFARVFWNAKTNSWKFGQAWNASKEDLAPVMSAAKDVKFDDRGHVTSGGPALVEAICKFVENKRASHVSSGRTRTLARPKTEKLVDSWAD